MVRRSYRAPNHRRIEDHIDCPAEEYAMTVRSDRVIVERLIRWSGADAILHFQALPAANPAPKLTARTMRSAPNSAPSLADRAETCGIRRVCGQRVAEFQVQHWRCSAECLDCSTGHRAHLLPGPTPDGDPSSSLGVAVAHVSLPCERLHPIQMPWARTSCWRTPCRPRLRWHHPCERPGDDRQSRPDRHLGEKRNRHGVFLACPRDQ